MRRRGKVDANHKEVVDGLRASGFTVQSLADIGGGCPDILCGKGGYNVLLEIKMPGEGLTKDQVQWHEKWGGQVTVVFGIEHALELLGRRPRI